MLYIAKFKRLFERGHLIARRDKLLTHVALVAGFDDGPHNGGIADFLRLINLVPAWIPARVVVRKIGVVFLDAGDDVALHDLHVVDVEQYLHPLRADLAADLDRRLDMVAEIVRVALPLAEN